MAGATPTADELRRWLTHPTVGRLPFPPEFQEGTDLSRVALDAWVRMHRAGDEVEYAERRHGVTSPSAVRWRQQARQARAELLFLLDTTAEDLQAQYSPWTARGRNALALGRY